MSENVNVLIEKMNKESLKKKPIVRAIPYGVSDEGNESMSIAGSQVAILRENKHLRNVSGSVRSKSNHSPSEQTHRELTEREMKNDEK